MLSINEEINNIWTKINELLFKLGHKIHYNAKCSDGKSEIYKYQYEGFDAGVDGLRPKKAETLDVILNFEYSKIGIFQLCKYNIGEKRQIVDADKHFHQNYRVSSKKLGIKEKEILIITNNCKNPFSNIISTSENQIMVSHNGVIFFLKRIK